MKLAPLLLLITVFSSSCSFDNKPSQLEQWKNEVVSAEKAFSEMAMKDGIPKAFLSFAAEDAVIMRNDSLIKGINGLREFFGEDRKSTRLNSSHRSLSRMPSSA